MLLVRDIDESFNLNNSIQLNSIQFNIYLLSSSIIITMISEYIVNNR